MELYLVQMCAVCGIGVLYMFCVGYTDTDWLTGDVWGKFLVSVPKNASSMNCGDCILSFDRIKHKSAFMMHAQYIDSLFVVYICYHVFLSPLLFSQVLPIASMAR